MLYSSKKITNIFLLSIVVVLLILVFLVVFPFNEALAFPCDFSGDCGGTGGLTNPLGYNTISGFLTAILDAVVLIAFPFVVLALVYTGFLFVSARGSEEKVTKAKTAFLWTVIGALIVLGAAVLSKAIEGTVNQIRGDTQSGPTITLR